MSHTTRSTGMISLIVVGASPSLLPELQRALPDSNCLSVADAAGAQAMLAHADASVVLVDFCAAKASQLLRQMDEDPAFDGLALMAAIPAGDSEAEALAYRCGALRTIALPFDAETLRQEICGLTELTAAVRRQEARRWKSQLAHRSQINEKTGLWNWQTFCSKTEQRTRARSDCRYVLAHWDIDRFMLFNQTFGIAEGDRFLANLGMRYRNLFEGMEGVVSFGYFDADNFLACWEKDAFDAASFCRLVTEQTCCVYSNYRFTVRFGFCEFDNSGADIALICDQALLALRSTKQHNDAFFAWYDESLRLHVLEEQQLLSEMDTAIAEEQFLVYFQPQYNYDTKELVGAEALVRWKHPQKGMIPPDRFIPLYEQRGFIFELDRYIWNRVCRQLRAWLDMGIRIPKVSVNVSRRDLLHPQFVDVLRNLLKTYRLSPALLGLEITESAYMENSHQLIQAANALREAGFSIEIDDFGSGYSCLNTLRDVPVDLLKLDMKFLFSEHSDRGGRILSSIVRMAHSLDLPVLAEGVETRQQADYLKSINCLLMQGYYFAKPLPAEEFERLLREAEGCSSIQDRLKRGIDGAADFLDASTQSALLFNSFVGGAGIVEYDGVCLNALRLNDQFFEQLAITPTEYGSLSHDLLDYCAPESRGALIAALESAIQTGQETGLELFIRSLRGNSPPSWLRCRLRFLAKKVESCIFYCSIENISQQKRLQLICQSVSHAIPGGIAAYEVRPDGIFRQYASESMAALTGWTQLEYAARGAEDLLSRVDPPDRPRMREAIHSAMEQGTSLDLTFRAIHKDGHAVWLNLRGRRTGEQNGHPLLLAVFISLSSLSELYPEAIRSADGTLPSATDEDTE